MSAWLPFILAFGISVVFTKIVIEASGYVRWLVRHPSESRWHAHATATMGGIAFVVAYSIVHISFFGLNILSQGPLSDHLGRLLVGSWIIFALGLWDDIRPLPPYAKLIGQIIVASAMVKGGIHAHVTGNLLIFMPLTILWFLTITNAFNLLDNMDGLSGGVSVIACLALAFQVFMTDGDGTPLSALAMAGAVGGFLVFNINPAKIFMGDCGSQWLGFMLAGLTLIGSWSLASNLFLVIAIPVLILGVPIFDTALVALDRKLHGRGVSQGGKDHSSHRLVALGLTPRKTVYLLWGLSLLFASIALLAQLYKAEVWAFAVGGMIIFAVVLGMFLTDVKVYEKVPDEVERKLGFLSFNLLYKRRIVEILLDTALVGGAYVLAYYVRFDWAPDEFQMGLLKKSLPVVIAVKLSSFLVFGLYRGIWSYVDFESFGRLVKIAVLATAFTLLSILGLYRFEGFSRTLFFIDFALLILMMGGIRALLRGLRETVFAFPKEGKKILIIGAGEGCRFLLHEIRRRRDWGLKPVAIVDDNRKKIGGRILGIPVTGPTARIPEVSREANVDHAVIAIPSLTRDGRNRIESILMDAEIPYSSMPSLEESLIWKIR